MKSNLGLIAQDLGFFNAYISELSPSLGHYKLIPILIPVIEPIPAPECS